MTRNTIIVHQPQECTLEQAQESLLRNLIAEATLWCVGDLVAAVPATEAQTRAAEEASAALQATLATAPLDTVVRLRGEMAARATPPAAVVGIIAAIDATDGTARILGVRSDGYTADHGLVATTLMVLLVPSPSNPRAVAPRHTADGRGVLLETVAGRTHIETYETSRGRQQ